jgi:glyoxylate/hydroxypyruvate reductase A
MTRVLFAGRTDHAPDWCAALRERLPGIDLTDDVAGTDPADVDILVYAPNGPITDLAPYTGVAAIQCVWAGVETLLDNPTLPEGPVLLRMVEPGLTVGMTDYVVGNVMRVHLGIDGHKANQAQRIWSEDNPPLSSDRHVGIVGLGALGRDAAEKLVGLGFQVSGWSRSAKHIDGVRSLHGPEGFETLLADADVLVLLAPLTAETEDMFDAAAFGKMKRGAHVINAARGQLIVDEALLAALDSGQVGGATLDVFRTEPLPQDHPYWEHPSVTITPHIASVTRRDTAMAVVAEQIRRFERGEPFENIVDRESGY